AIAFILALWLRNAVFVPWYAAKVQGVPAAAFYMPTIPGFLGYAALVAAGYPLISILSVPASIADIALVSAAISIVYLAVVARVVLTGPERDLIRSVLPSPISRRVPSWLL
ncbi:MAG TPA: polysaccharide biosynthesis protein, partial [Methanoculleus thermophilus]|nr:polysaccharide biosynthesis protein [Methanoculleus thermophilus]